MTFDFRVTTDGTLTTNELGDIDTVRGTENVKQQIRLALQAVVPPSPDIPLTQSTQRDIRTSISEALASSDYVNEVVSIAVSTRGDETLVATVRTTSEQLQVTY